MVLQKLGRIAPRGRGVIFENKSRHCERSEPIHLTAGKEWIASSRSLSSGAHSRDPLAPRNDGAHTAIASKSFGPAKIYSLKPHASPPVARRNDGAD